jgi:hypothetical protein
MAAPPWVHLLLVLVVFAACGANPLVEGGLRPSVISCSTAGNYSDGSEYHKNLYNLLLAIPMGAANNGGFFNGTVGAEVDEVFGLFMCYASTADSACLDCLIHAPEGIRKLCPHSRTVRAVYGACTLRYSNESFFSVADLAIVNHVQQIPDDEDTLAAYVVDTAGMSRTRLELLRRLTERAGLAAGRVAEDNQRFNDAQWMYGVAQCTRDLPASECTRCLSNFTDQLPRLFPNNSRGEIKGYSCYLSYYIITEEPKAWQLKRERYSETYERRMAAEESDRSEERQKRRRRRRRKVASWALSLVQ